MPGKTPFLTRWRVRLGYPAAIVVFFLARPTTNSIFTGAALGALGLLVRGAAAGHLRKHEGLATSGPYGHTRNPLYLGSALLAAGLLIGAHSWIAAVLVAAYFLAFYPGVIKHEDAELRRHYGKDYEEYCALVPIFWPSTRRFDAGNPPQQFSWLQYRRNREYQALLGFLGAMALLWVLMAVRK